MMVVGGCKYKKSCNSCDRAKKYNSKIRKNTLKNYGEKDLTLMIN